SLVPIELTKDAATGVIGVKASFTGLGTNTATTGGARFVTTNNGNEYRNANHPIAFTANGGTAVCAEYNYQPNNNTERYLQCFNQAGATILPQTRIYAKDNDDCSMNQDKSSTWLVDTKPTAAGSVSRFVAWRGCNGNGQDDGWMQQYTITFNSATTPTSA